VLPGDPSPKPAPTDKTYKPRPGEVRETFKCSGEVYYGYRGGCVELSNTSLSAKWLTEIGVWLDAVPKRIEALRADFQDKVINTGTREDCERHCRYLGYAEFAVVGAIIPTACFLILKSPSCANVAGTNVVTQVGTVVVANGTLSTVAQTEATVECVKHVCERR
jgi:hypothetical protein